MAEWKQPGMGDDDMYRGDQSFPPPAPAAPPAPVAAPSPSAPAAPAPAPSSGSPTGDTGWHEHQAPPPPPAPRYGPAPSTERNWMGILAMILAILTVTLPALVLAGMGLNAASQGRATNRGLALSALIVAIVWPIVLIGSVVAIGSAFDGAGEQRSTQELYLGECIRQPSGWSDEGGELPSAYVRVVGCDEEHWAQVVHVGYLTGFGAYPADDELWASADDICYADQVVDRIEPWALNRVYITYLVPSLDGWNGGDRKVTCMVADTRDSDITVSWVDGY